MNRGIPLIVFVLLTGCGTVTIENLTFSTSRHPTDSYEVTALVRPTLPSVTILNVETDAIEPAGTFALGTTRFADVYSGRVTMPRCAEVINLTYRVDYERRGLFGRVRRTAVHPDPGVLRIPIVGESPPACLDGPVTANQLMLILALRAATPS